MEIALWSFLGMDKKIVTEPERRATNLLESYFSVVSDVAGVNYREFDKIETFINKAVEKAPSYNYFWDWLNRYGIDKFRELSLMKLDSRKEEILGILDYRAFVLSQYQETCNEGSLLTAIADSISFVCLELSEVLSSVEEYVDVQRTSRIFGPTIGFTTFSLESLAYGGRFFK